MTDKILEALGMLQEECAEVIQEVSKCRRFGFDSAHYITGELHRERLTQEIGDVLTLVDVLIQQGIVDQELLEQAKDRKLEKLRKWSTILTQ